MDIKLPNYPAMRHFIDKLLSSNIQIYSKDLYPKLSPNGDVQNFTSKPSQCNALAVAILKGDNIILFLWVVKNWLNKVNVHAKKIDEVNNKSGKGIMDS